MNDALTSDQHVAYRGATAPAAPGWAPAAPDARAATPAATASAPPAPRMGETDRPPTAGDPLPTAGAPKENGEASGRGTRWLAAVTLIGMIPVVLVGFAASYTTIKEKAHAAGFVEWLAPWVPIGLDGAIIGFLALDLYMTRRRTPWPFLRFAAHAMTAATVILNAAAGQAVARVVGVPANELLAAPVRVLWHGLMPVLFVVGVEAVRRLIVHAVDLEDGTAIDRIPLHRWALSPWKTPKLYREMRLAAVTSYPEMVQRKQDLAGYEVWLTQKYDGDLSKASEAERLPMKMASRGYTVDKALDLPEKWESAAAERDRKEKERQRQEAERQRLEAEEEEERQHQEAERQRLRAKNAKIAAIADRGDIVEAEHMTDARTGTAAAQAELAKAKAELHRVKAERIARTEAEVIESAEAAAARRAAAIDNEKAAEAELRAAQLQDDAARKTAEAERRQQETEDAAARRISESNRLAAEAEEAAKAELRTARLREETERIEAAAEAAADYAGLKPRQRQARRVARLLLAAHPAGTPADQIDHRAVSLTTIEEQRLATSRTIAGELRQEAMTLISQGYTGTQADADAVYESRG